MTKASNITEEVLKRIEDKVYRIKIPGQRQLAVEFDVNVKTINRALNPLVKRGVLFRRKGEGTFITADDHHRSLNIGLCFFKHTDPSRDPVFTRFFFGANSGAKHHGVRIQVFSYREVANYEENDEATNRQLFLEWLMQAQVDGFIFIGNLDVEIIQMVSTKVPAIVIGHTPRDTTLNSVRRDVRNGTADAVKRLATTGHRNIALASVENPHEAYDLIAKETGYQEAMYALGLQPHIVRSAYGDICQNLLACEQLPSAVICVESNYGLSLMKQAPKHGINIPDDLAVISFDDGDVGSFIHPSMSGIHAFGEDVAASAMEHLINKIDGNTSTINVCLPCPFFERDSSSLVLEAS